MRAIDLGTDMGDSMKHVTMVVLFGALLSVSGGVSAQDAAAPALADESEAQMHFELGRRFYETGRFLQAAGEFDAAIAIAPLPALYFNLYLALRDGGARERAAQALRLYIGTLDPGDRRTRLQARLRVMETSTEADNAEVVQAPAPFAVPADAGGVDSGPGPAPWIVVGGGGVLVAAALVTGLLASGERSSLDSICPTPDTCAAGFEENQSRGEALAITTDVLWITGAAAITAGALWALLGTSGEQSTPRAGLACDDHGCMATLRGEL